MAYIYKIINDINDKVYVGKTTRTLGTRFYEHRRDSENPTPHSKIHNAMKKYGTEHFKIEQIEECSTEEINERERFWIKYYNSFNNGYNNTNGGDGISLSDEVIDNIYFEWDNGLSQKEISEKLNLSLSTVAHRLLNYKNYSREESLKRSYKDRVRSVDQYDDQGNKINTFYSLKEAGTAVGVTGTNIQKACSEHGKSGGFYWTYKDEPFQKKKPSLYGGHGDRRKNGKQKKVAKLDDKENILEIFESATDAAYSIGKERGSVAACCRGSQKTCGGFKWKYLEE